MGGHWALGARWKLEGKPETGGWPTNTGAGGYLRGGEGGVQKPTVSAGICKDADPC